MQVVHTSNGDSIAIGMASKADKNEVIKLAKDNPNKTIVLTDVVFTAINEKTYLDVLGESKPDNITASPELWRNLKPSNFKAIRKSLFVREFGNIIASDVDSQQVSVKRAAKALEVLDREYGVSDIKIGNRNGVETILANRDNQECVVNIMMGNVNDKNGREPSYKKQIAPHLKLVVFPDGVSDAPIIYNGMTFNKFYEDPTKTVYIPDKNSMNRLPEYAGDMDKAVNRAMGEVALECIDGINYEYAAVADFTDMYSEFIDYCPYYVVALDGEPAYRNNNNAYECRPEGGQTYKIIPSLTCF